MVQNNYIDELIKRQGVAINSEFKQEKKLKRKPAIIRRKSRKLTGHQAKMFMKKRRKENAEKKKEEKGVVKKNVVKVNTAAVPAFLLDRGVITKSKDEAVDKKNDKKKVKYQVPIPKVVGVSEKEAFKSLTTGSKRKNHWKRLITKPCFVGENFTRKPPKYERFIRPMGLRFKKAHVTNSETNSTHCLPIISIKKNPHSDLYTNLGILSKGSIIEVNVSELGIVSNNGKIVWGKYAQITNNPENDGCINAVLLV